MSTQEVNHYGHNVDITQHPMFCSDCDVEFDVDKQLDEAIELSRKEWLLGGYTTKELHAELARRQKGIK